MAHWEKSNYQKIKTAGFVNGKVMVDFENGDQVELPKEAIASFDTYEVLWDQIQSNSYEVTIPAKPNSIEIPWDKIRVLTDTEFGKYLANRAEEQATLIGTKIKRLREKKGIKSNELAERAGVTPQTISRIEKGHTDLSFGTLRKILASMGYSLRDLANQEAEFESESASKNLDTLVKRLTSVGIDSALLRNKIIPRKIQTTLMNYKGAQPDLLLDEAASYVSSIYGWKVNEIWSSSRLQIKTEPFKSAFFKMPATANVSQVKAYSHYAYYLAKIVCKTQTVTEKSNYPNDIDEFRINYTKKYKSIQLKSLLKYVWELGICVLPLDDSGVFHGASWNIDGKHVIVLKQNTKSHARWIYDLLHEVYHVFAHLEEANTSVIETEELTPYSSKDESPEELEANAFAHQVLFGAKAEELAEKAIAKANYKIENLKNSVVKVADSEGIRVDFLSNYLAYRLSFQGENWWGTAAKMQIVEPDPFQMATEILKENVSIKKLNPIDFNLLTTALSN